MPYPLKISKTECTKLNSEFKGDELSRIRPNLLSEFCSMSEIIASPSARRLAVRNKVELERLATELGSNFAGGCRAKDRGETI